MKRTLLVALLLTISVAGVGCTMCQNCWDYEGPVVGPDGVPTEGFADRAGSILGSGPGGMTVDEATYGVPTEAVPNAGTPTEAVPTPAATPAEEPAPSTGRPSTLRRR